MGAAREAGYKRPDPQGRENLRKPTVRAAIDLLRQDTTSAAIATRHERQAFWKTVLKDAEEDMRHRLKASELLGRSQADFIDRVDAEVRIIVEHVHEGIEHG